MFLLLVGNVSDMLFDLFPNFFDMMKRYGLITLLIIKNINIYIFLYNRELSDFTVLQLLIL
jgi:hypothetical protein